jgi:hypothetical protein
VAVATEARDRTILLSAGGLTLAGVIFWLLSAADAQAKKSERARRRLPDQDFPNP